MFCQYDNKPVFVLKCLRSPLYEKQLVVFQFDDPIKSFLIFNVSKLCKHNKNRRSRFEFKWVFFWRHPNIIIKSSFEINCSLRNIGSYYTGFDQCSGENRQYAILIHTRSFNRKNDIRKVNLIHVNGTM